MTTSVTKGGKKTPPLSTIILPQIHSEKYNNDQNKLFYVDVTIPRLFLLKTEKHLFLFYVRFFFFDV